MRMNISVSDELKARMDRVKEDVNWSALACRAFEAKLGEIAARKEKKNMQDVIERLKASKIESQGEISAEGRRDGEAWARDHAEYSELREIAKALRDAEGQPCEAFEVAEENRFTGAQLFVWTIRPHVKGDIMEAGMFWEAEGFEKGSPDDDYVQAFAEGAMVVWNQVVTKL